MYAELVPALTAVAGFIKINEPQSTLTLRRCSVVIIAFIALLFDTKAENDCRDCQDRDGKTALLLVDS